MPHRPSRLGMPAVLLLLVLSAHGTYAFAAGPAGPPPGGARELQPGQLPRQCTEADGAINAYGSNYGYYWSETSNRWISAPFCYPRWGHLQASPSQIIAPGATVTVSAIPDDARLTGAVAVQGGMTWGHPGTVVSGCTTKDMDCTVKVGQAGVRPIEWQWYEFHVSGPGRVFILPPSYAPRCQPDLPCLDTFTNAWSFVGIAPDVEEPSVDATLEAAPADVEIGDTFTVTMKVTNPNTTTLTDVQPSAPIVVNADDGDATMLSGPSPASVASLAPGATTAFTWQFEATVDGAVGFNAEVEATTSSGGTVTAIAMCHLGSAPLVTPPGARVPAGCSSHGAASVAITPKLGVTWEVPAHYFNTSVYGTDDGVIPIEDVNPSTWPVTLILTEKGKELTTCPPGKVYQWKMKLKDAKPKPKAPPIEITDHSCRPTVPVDREGEYNVTVEELLASDETTVVRAARDKTVIVQDWLIVGMGDSNASGQGTVEGNDHSGYEFPQCDRGRYSYQALVAERIEANDRRTSVTFIHTGCSGARTPHIESKKYAGQEPIKPVFGHAYLLPPQLKQVTERLKGSKIRRQVDAVILSIGINDVNFGGILGLCIKSPHDQMSLPMCPDLHVRLTKAYNGEPTLEEDPGRGPTLDVFIEKTVTKKLPRLYQGLKSLATTLKIPQERVYHTGYPEPTKDAAGMPCGRTSFLPLDPVTQAMFQDEWAWLGATGQKLEEQILANYNGWTIIPVGHRFAGHGYCTGGQSWFQSILGSLIDQRNPYGTFHSRREGHDAMAKEVLPVLCQDMFGTDDCKGGTVRSPGK